MYKIMKIKKVLIGEEALEKFPSLKDFYEDGEVATFEVGSNKGGKTWTGKKEVNGKHFELFIPSEFGK